MSKNEKQNFSLPCLLYDDQCLMCIRFKQALAKIPGAKDITMIPLNNCDVYQIYPFLNKSDCQKELHIIDIDQKVHKGEDALVFLIKQFPGVSKFAWLMESEIGKKATSFFYETVNKHRERLKKRCPDCK